MEYKILEGGDASELEKEVNELIQQGWKPLGGVAVDEAFCCQAMIKEEA